MCIFATTDLRVTTKLVAKIRSKRILGSKTPVQVGQSNNIKCEYTYLSKAKPPVRIMEIEPAYPNT